mmetsp:Transcript_85915/g.246620  ORF Transcript_85915/g.246620 Transcript_85915/m.246620 type:complete len:294 (+) Transcript_85915:258-1139(+)
MHRLEAGIVVCHGSGPTQPVQLHICVPVVHRGAVFVLLRNVVFDLRRTQGLPIKWPIQAQELLPNHIVLDGVGARHAESDHVVIVLPSELLPSRREVAGGRAVASAVAAQGHHAAELSEGLERDDAFRPKVRVVGQPTLEVVCADLICREGQRLLQIVGPHEQHLPIGLQKGHVGASAREAHEHQEHVARVLHWHPLLLCGVVVRNGVRSDLVWGERIAERCRSLVVGERQHRNQEQLQQLGVAVEEGGRCRIDHVHGLHVSVRGDLLQEVPHDLPLRVPDQLGRCQGLPIRE